MVNIVLQAETQNRSATTMAKDRIGEINNLIGGDNYCPPCDDEVQLQEARPRIKKNLNYRFSSVSSSSPAAGSKAAGRLQRGEKSSASLLLNKVHAIGPSRPNWICGFYAIPSKCAAAS